LRAAGLHHFAEFSRDSFDVHHILGADKSDRIYNCVALCPNCHREVHFAPDHDEVNGKLLDFAMKFKSAQ
jgi:5-methylcytosine-specific restriction protein A